MKNISWRLVSVIIVILAAVIYTLPTFYPRLWPHKKINFGLDLQGGMHLALEVEVDKAVQTHMQRIADDLKSQLKKEKIRPGTYELGNTPPRQNVLTVTLPGKEAVDGFQTVLDRNFPELRLLERSTEGENKTIRLNLPDKEIETIKRLAVDQALETIRNRIDQFGVSEADIRRQGTNRILIQLPGIKDTRRAKDLIGKTAVLEFKLVDEENDPAAAAEGKVPAGSQLLYEIKTNRETRRSVKTPFLVKKRTLLTGADLKDARVQIDSQYNEPNVSITFGKKGGRLFSKITEENVGKRMAIVLDDRMYSAPVIQEKISGGQARITGRFSMNEAHDLAIVLRAGALPAPVKILEERTVGPSLGEDSIKNGFLSMVIGGLLVILFMAVYYKLSGILADAALLVNILLMAGGLAAFGATLTLPGIAGFILTIGMAVDANVLIFERIREELQTGKTPRAAVDTGYELATLTILDANVTTLIAALVLFQFGTGPVKGFAVTLSLGVLASLFTALVLTRGVFDYFLVKRKVSTISI